MSEKAVVLIVDDRPANIQLLAECLKEQYRIKVATDGLRCLELVSKDADVDLIQLDIEMPGLDGYEVCQRLKQNQVTADIPVIFVTSHDQQENEELGLELGAVDYITKPVRPSIVSARVKTHITLKRQRDQLLAMATHDQLTGLYNRHFLIEEANKKVAHAVRHHIPLSLFIIDIDHFKNINDRYGHPTGDAVLNAVACLLHKQCREEDIVARFGGEEFVILLDHCDLEEAMIKAENFRRDIAVLQPENILVTASFGITQMFFEQDENIDGLIKRADQALYEAKQAGRNCVYSG